MKIRTKFAVGLLLLGLLALIVNLGLVILGANEMRGTITDSMAVAASESMHSLEVSLNKDVSYLQTYSTRIGNHAVLHRSNQQFESVENRQQYIDDRDQAWRQASQGGALVQDVLENDLSRSLQAREQRDTVTSEIIVTNRHGALVGATGKTTDYRQDDEAWWKQARQDGIYIDYQFDESADTWGVEIALPLQNGNRSFQGVMSVLIPMDAIGAILLDNRHSTDIIQSIDLVAGDGTVLYSTGHHEPGETITDHAVFQKATGAQGSIITTTHQHDGNRLYTYAQLTGTGALDRLDWTLFLEYDPAAVMKPLELLKTRFLISTVLLVVMAMVTMWIIANSFLTPIQHLTAIISDISRGDTDTDIPEHMTQRDDEVGALARAFDRTLVSLKLAMQKTAPELEETVEQTEEEKADLETEQEKLLSLLEATLDVSSDGIAITDMDGDFRQYNQQFIDMWGLPEHIVATEDADEAVEYVKDRVKNPDAFEQQVEYLFNHPDETAHDSIELTDGTVLERHARPLELGDDIIGRVWRFREKTGETDKNEDP